MSGYIQTPGGRLTIEVVDGALHITGKLTVYSASHVLDLTLHPQPYGFYRRTMSDLVLTRIKDDQPGSHRDREQAIEYIVERANEWAESEEGRAGVATAAAATVTG